MSRRFCILAAVAAIVVIAAASGAEATYRHIRLGHLPAPKTMPLPPEVDKAIKKEFPTGKVTGHWLEEKGEMEVFVSVPGSPVIEVVFLKKGAGPWHLAGYEYPVPTAALTPKAMSAIKAKYPAAKIVEVELVFNASWVFCGYQVTLHDGSGTHEVFLTAGGTFAKDPL